MRLLARFLHAQRGRTVLSIRSAIVAVLFFSHAPAVSAQAAEVPGSDDISSSPALFPHSESSRWWISGQINTILQAHPRFHAQYSGQNSLKPYAEVEDSRLLTLYLGFEATRTTEIFVDAESAGGHGLSSALGILGTTNADVVRNPSLGAAPYLARILVRQIIPLSREWSKQERDPLSLHSRLPLRRVEIRAGKFALPDEFDVNEVGSNDRLQFMNLTAVTSAAWVYAGDSRGYTYAASLEFADRGWAMRFAEALMPSVPNGIKFEWNLGRARSENVELEVRPQLLKSRQTALRFLSFVNHSNAGSYAEAVALYRAGKTSRPIIEPTRLQGRLKYGFGMNLEQDLTERLRLYARFGWNDTRYESFEITQNFDFGGDYSGSRWHRKRDKVGAALLSHGLARNVQEYLALGGVGLLLGDGALRYGRENIVEGYYNMHLWRGLFAAIDLQHVSNPGYNRDRGPVWVPSLRLHLEL